MKSSHIVLTLAGVFVLGCSGNSSNSDGSGGSMGAGGGQTDVGGQAAATGGAALGTGGNAATGGNVPGTGGASVVNATGGMSTATGGKATGGAYPATGGKAATGGSTPGIGGSATGGTSAGPATGGQPPATGGKSSTGGTSAGGQSGGGKSSTGGMSATGGLANGGTTSAGGAASKSSGCGKTSTIPSSQYNNGTTIPITVGTMQRRFILNVPKNYDNTKPYKLIFAWHQLDGNDKQMYNNGYYHLLPLSGDNAIFVAPNGQKNGAACTGTGNGESGCGWPNTNGVDIALADAVLAQIEQNFCVDTNRIFATGWSYGGSMSYKHACERGLGGTKSGVAGYVRGIAVYSGAQLSGTCTPTTPVAYYGSHGTNDTVLNYDGGVGLAQNFAKVNGCTWATPTKITSGNHVCTSMTGCTSGYPTEFCSFNGPHTPDPTDPGQSKSWQYQLVWDFFNQF